MLRARFVDAEGEHLDDILLSVHARPPGPRSPSPSGQDHDWEIRLHLHGGAGVMQRCRESLAAAGFREARENGANAGAGLFGERTRLEREASALLPRILTLQGASWLLRQPLTLAQMVRKRLDDLAKHGAAALAAGRAECAAAAARLNLVNWFTRPLRVAVIGPPNAGKSTLINALCARPVSLVSPQPGTTRDWVEALDEIEGFPVAWIDTAGWRHADDEIEAEAIRRARRVLAEADRAVLVLDSSPDGAAASAAFSRVGGRLTPDVVVMNKCDLLAEASASGKSRSSMGGGLAPPAAVAPVLDQLPTAWRKVSICAAATTGLGVDALRRRLLEASGRRAADLAHPAAFTPRQADRLAAAASATTAQPARAALLECLGET
ncbi:MAG: 50S ribosome-binding GTPase [Phycisphaerae bacterium]|nr:50S ribosome-binding GTPase [Phycisphaerae bacterium]